MDGNLAFCHPGAGPITCGAGHGNIATLKSRAGEVACVAFDAEGFAIREAIAEKV